MADHDHSYKNLFSHPELVRDLLQGFVAEQWVDDLDLDTLEKVNSSYISDDLREREDDIIWRVQLGGSWIYVYLLIEFQSTQDQYMALRLLTYVGLLYQDLQKSDQLLPNKKLPPVLPVVLYNGSKEWRAPLTIQALIQDVGGGLSRYRPDFEYLLLEEQSYRAEDLPGANLVSAIFTLEKSQTPEDIRKVVSHLIQWLKSPEQTSLRRAFTVWIHRVLLPARVPGQNIPEVNELVEVETMLAERVKEWTKEWQEEGMQKGMQKGMQNGIKKGEVQLLIRQLKTKFDTLSPEFINRLEQANEEQILLWSERILTADKLSDVFGN